MNTNDRDDRSAGQAGDAHRPIPGNPVSTVTTFTYVAQESLTTGWPAPQRTPISDEEMDSLMKLLGDFRVRLLWLHCEWAEAARQGQLAPEVLEANVAKVFGKLRQRFLAHIVAALAACPAPIVVAPPPRDGL